MLGCFFSITGLSNLLNKIQFTFEVVSCLISGLSDDFLEVCINFGPVLQGGGRMGGKEGWGGRWQKILGEDTGPPVTLRWS